MTTRAIPNARRMPWSDLGTTRRAALTVFLDGRSHTRADIASALNQSVPTAAAHIAALVERGLLEEVGSQAAVGRPASSWQLRPNAAAAIGMELRPGGPRRAAGRLCSRVVRLDGSVARERITPVYARELQSIRSFVEREARNISLSEEVSDLPLVSLGLAVPGVVDCERALLVHAPNLFLWNVSFAGLDETLGIPVVVENEANASALAEYLLWAGITGSAPAVGRTGTSGVGHTATSVVGSAAPSSASGAAAGGRSSGGPGESLVRISITEGVGAGIIVGGRLVRGDTWRAGEFGHMAIREGNRRCNCGRSGCWEQYVSEWALLSDARGAGLRSRSVNGFLRQVARGGAAAVSVWRGYVHNLAIGIENVVACVDPGTIIVGGDIAGAGELLVVPLRHEVESVSFLTSGVQVDVSRGGSWAAAVGAALLTFGDVYTPTAALMEGVA